jgi:hypothetical protein
MPVVGNYYAMVFSVTSVASLPAGSGWVNILKRSTVTAYCAFHADRRVVQLSGLLAADSAPMATNQKFPAASNTPPSRSLPSGMSRTSAMAETGSLPGAAWDSPQGRLGSAGKRDGACIPTSGQSAKSGTGAYMRAPPRSRGTRQPLYARRSLHFSSPLPRRCGPFVPADASCIYGQD